MSASPMRQCVRRCLTHPSVTVSSVMPSTLQIFKKIFLIKLNPQKLKRRAEEIEKIIHRLVSVNLFPGLLKFGGI